MQSNAKQCKAMQSKAKQSKAKQSKAKQSKAMQSKAKQSNAKQSNAKQSNAMQSKAMQCKAIQCNAQCKCSGNQALTLGEPGGAVPRGTRLENRQYLFYAKMNAGPVPWGTEAGKPSDTITDVIWNLVRTP